MKKIQSVGEISLEFKKMEQIMLRHDMGALGQMRYDALLAAAEEHRLQKRALGSLAN